MNDPNEFYLIVVERPTLCHPPTVNSNLKSELGKAKTKYTVIPLYITVYVIRSRAMRRFQLDFMTRSACGEIVYFGCTVDNVMYQTKIFLLYNYDLKFP